MPTPARSYPRILNHPQCKALKSVPAGPDLRRSLLHGRIKERVVDLDPIIALFRWWDNMIMQRQIQRENGDVAVESQPLEDWLKQLVIQFHAEHWEQFQLQKILSIEGTLEFLKTRMTSPEVRAFIGS